MCLSLILAALAAPVSAPAALATPLSPMSVPAVSAPAEHAAAVTWHEGSFLSARGAADEREANVLVYFWSDGSEQCSRLYQETMSDEHVAGALNSVVCFSAKLGDRKGNELAERYNVRTVPTLLLVRPDGEVEDAVIGFIDPGGLVEEVARMGRGEGTVTDLLAKAAAEPDSTEAAMALAIKYQDVGQEELYDGQLHRVRELDPKGTTEEGARAGLYLVISDVTPKDSDYVEGEEDPLIVTKPVEKLLAKLENDAVAIDGWNWVASVHAEQEDAKSARKAYMSLWKRVSDEEVLGWGNRIAWSFWEQREELSKKEKRFALKLAHAAVEATNEESREGVGGDGGTDAGSDSGSEEEQEEHPEGDEYEGMSEADRMVWRAGYLDTLACCQYMNGKRKEAIATIELCIELAPDWEELAEHKQLFVSRG